MKNVLFRFSALFLALGILWILPQRVSARTVEFQTTQVTAADVALSPDGKTLVFTILGHLFKLPPNGGTAEQLTFGPYYDNDPVFSPDGSQVAFTSDRDGSEGNIFVLSLGSRQILQMTRDEHAGRPTWSPDGKSIAYLQYGRWTPAVLPAVVSRISVQGGKPETLSAPPKRIGSTFYLPDGRLAWSVIEHDSESNDYVTRIETLTSEGTAATLRTIRGYVDRVLSSPSGDGLYCHRLIGDRWLIPTSEGIVSVPLPAGADKDVLPVSALGRFALSSDGKSLYAAVRSGFGLSQP